MKLVVCWYWGGNIHPLVQWWCGLSFIRWSTHLEYLARGITHLEYTCLSGGYRFDRRFGQIRGYSPVESSMVRFWRWKCLPADRSLSCYPSISPSWSSISGMSVWLCLKWPHLEAMIVAMNGSRLCPSDYDRRLSTMIDYWLTSLEWKPPPPSLGPILGYRWLPGSDYQLSARTT